jgi:hypothetical protein
LDDRKKDEHRITEGKYKNPVRDLTKFLNKEGWDTLTRKVSR